MYTSIPFVFKVRSNLSVRRAKQLMADACEKDNHIQKKVGTHNWTKELTSELEGKRD